MLGRRYLGQNGLRALGLIALAGLGLFLIADSGVKDRLTKTIDKAGEISPEAGKQVAAASQEVDFRIPIALDTLDLIKNFKWTGIGAGQYYFIFPQYRSRTVVANSADNYHPESDWLWLAAEAGVPAALAMAALVAFAFWKSTASILRGRNRALRSACLVAAMLVPIHGLFDVPGHRITLALSAALLFALSLDFPSSVPPPPRPRGWPSRMLGLALLAVALLLVRSQWWGGPQPALTAGASALAEARRLRHEDQVMQRNAAAQGKEYQPDPAQDRLDQALVVLEQSRNQVPLDRDVLRYQAFLAFHFDDKQGLIDRVFAIDRALTPTWVEGPMRQAEAWSGTDPTKSVVLWKESLRRARNLDRLQNGNDWSSARTLERIRQFTKDKPGLEYLVPTSD
ncbi:MAG: O-antigen ligase family protein [Opitutaceae bacterium]|nr:O-antigen ligase family protein [Verrucomicrobiales bacterium]